MTRLFLIRHASTDWSGTRFCGRSDPPLDETGRAEVEALVARITALRVSVKTVRSSPARRAVETAGPLASALEARLELDERLSEADFGRLDGCTFDEVAHSWPDIARSLRAADTAIDWPQGERAGAFAARCRSVARDLEAATGDTLVVTHGGPIRAIAALLGVDASRADLAPAELLALERGTKWRAVELRQPTEAWDRATWDHVEEKRTRM